MITVGATVKGLTTEACRFAASSVGRFRILCGRPNAVISRMNRANAATASGAMVIERFSHSSRRIVQYMRSFSGLFVVAATRDYDAQPVGTLLADVHHM